MTEITSLSFNTTLTGAELVPIYQGSGWAKLALSSLLYKDGSGRFLGYTTTPTAASIGASSLQIAGEIMARGSQGGIFWEDRTSAVTGTSNWAGWYATGGTVYFWNGSANKASINGTSGAYTALSDKTKKRDFAPSPYALSHVLKLKPQLFRMKDEADDAPLDLGLLAQDVKKIIPHAYVEHAVPGEKPFISYKDRAIIAVLIGAIQELSDKVSALEAKLAAGFQKSGRSS